MSLMMRVRSATRFSPSPRADACGVVDDVCFDPGTEHDDDLVRILGEDRFSDAEAR